MCLCGAQVTEGPHAGKLALLDFGLVAEIPAEDREAMVSGAPAFLRCCGITAHACIQQAASACMASCPRAWFLMLLGRLTAGLVQGSWSLFIASVAKL